MNALLEQYKQRSAELEIPAGRESPLNEPVQGRKLDQMEETQDKTSTRSLGILMAIMAVALLIVLVGFGRKSTTMRINGRGRD